MMVEIKARRHRYSEEEKRHTYPNCRGTFQDCPTEQEFSEAISKDKKNPPERCRSCWIFKISKFYTAPPRPISEGVLKLLQGAKEKEQN